MAPTQRRWKATRWSARAIQVALLVSAAWLAVADSTAARLVATASLGAVAYSTINSAGYYADRGNRAIVVMFGVLTVLVVVAIAVLLTA